MRAGNRKQALVPEGATVLEPVGTAPGLVVPPARTAGSWSCCPGPPRELQPMWARRGRRPTPLRALLARAGALEQRIMRLFGVPESEIAATLRELEADGVARRLEITTCLRRGELEIATVFAPGGRAAYDALEAGIRARHARHAVLRRRGDDRRAGRRGCSAGRTIAVAESCTGGLMAGRLTDRAGSSAYVLGGLVVYSNEAKVALAGVPAELIERHGAVSPEVARALADGARARFGADIGIGITGHRRARAAGRRRSRSGRSACAWPRAGGARVERTVQLPGDRADVRERTTTVAMHMLRALLLDVTPPLPPVRRARPPAAGARRARAPRRAPPIPRVWRPVAPRRAPRHARLPRQPPGRPTSTAIEAAAAAPAGPRRTSRSRGAVLLPPRRGRVLTARIADPDGALAALQAGRRARADAAGALHARDAAVPPARHGRPAAPARAPAADRVELRARAAGVHRRGGHALRLAPAPRGARYEPLARASLAG